MISQYNPRLRLGKRRKKFYSKSGLDLYLQRTRRNITAVDLAKRIGVHYVTIYKWEQGITPISKQARKMLEMLDFKLHSGTNDRITNPKDAAEKAQRHLENLYEYYARP